MPYLFVLFAILIIVLIVFGAIASARRKKELMAFAAANGLQFSPGRDYGMEDRFPAFDCLGEGSDRYAYNVLSGQWRGLLLLAFDYHYETESRDSKGKRTTHSHHFSAVVLYSPVPLKPLFIRAEGFFDKVTQFFGHDDIDFESAEFSRKFYVKSADRKWAYDVIHPRAMELLLAAPRFTIQFDTLCVMAYRSRTLKVPEFAVAADLVSDLLDGLPEYLVRELTGQD